MPERAPSDPTLEVEPLDRMEGNRKMTRNEAQAARQKMQNTVTAHREEVELEALVSVLGDPTAQRAADRHRLPELIASEQGHGMDYRSVA